MPAPFGPNDIQNLRTFSLDMASTRSGGAVQIPVPSYKKTPSIADALKKELSDIAEVRQPAEDKTADSVIFEKPEISQRVPPRGNKPQHELPLRAIHEHTKVTPVKEFEAIHEEVGRINVTEKESILAEHDESFEVNPTRSGSIIRDTKRKRFRLLPAMGMAVTGWWVSQKKAYNAVIHPHHAVAKAEARKDVIEEAVRYGTQAPKEDFELVAERMKHKKRAAVTSSTLTFKEKAEVPEPAWTHVQDEGAPAQQQHTDENPMEEASSRTVLPEVSVPQTHARTINIKAAPPLHQEEPAPEIFQESASDAAELEKEQPQTPVLEAHDFQEEQAHTPASQTQAETPETTQIKQTPRRYALAASIPQSPRMGTIFVVIAVAILSGVAFSYYLFGTKETPQEQAIVYKIPALLQAEQQEALPLSNDRQLMLGQLRARADSAQTTLQIYPVLTENGANRPASASEMLATLSLRAPGSFERSIREVTFGATAAHEPFIILSVGSFDTAFAGMLAWETTMSSDLSPFFGETVVESFDPSARTDTQVRNAFFKDTVASNKNVRLLLDEKGDDRIVYTFTDQDTILITTTRAALEELLPLVN